MRHFQGSPIPVGAGRLYYRRWVEEGLINEIENPFEAVKWQQVLGGEGFLRKLKDHWNQKVERPKDATRSALVAANGNYRPRGPHRSRGPQNFKMIVDAKKRYRSENSAEFCERRYSMIS